VLRRIFVPKREEVIGIWRKISNEELHNLYSSPNVIRVIKSKTLKRAGHVACMLEVINAYKNFKGKPKGKRPLRTPRRRWEDREIVWEDVAQIRDQWWALVNTLMNFLVP